MVILTEAEKEEVSKTICEHLPELRRHLNLTQSQLGYLCGFSRIRVSQIETGKAPMSWSQLTSILFVCEMNLKAKEYIYANHLLSSRFLQFIQQKDANIPPDINVIARQAIVDRAFGDQERPVL